MIVEKPFDKYEVRGPYHWEWYITNKYSYKDKLHMIRLHLPNTGTVLDIGGGDGVLSFLLFEHGLKVTSVDNNDRAAELAQMMVQKAVYGNDILAPLRRVLSQWDIRPRPLGQRYEAGEIRFLSQSIFDYKVESPFNYIVCHEVIEHVMEPARLLAWIYQNMTEYAIISTPNITNRSQHYLDYHSWTPETFSQLLTGYNFDFVFKNGTDMYVKLYK